MADIRRTSSIDTFDRVVPESPVLPPWFVVEGAQSPTIGNGVFSPNDVFSVTSHAYLGDRVFYGPEVELWAQRGEGADQTEESGMALFQTPFSLATRSGYSIRSGDAIGGSYTSLSRYDNGIETTGIDSVTDQIAGGSIIMLRLNGDRVEGWYSTDGGANWSLLLEGTDTTYRAFFYAYLRIDSDDAAGPTWIDLGGGTLNRQQEYRWFPSLLEDPLSHAVE